MQHHMKNKYQTWLWGSFLNFFFQWTRPSPNTSPWQEFMYVYVYEYTYKILKARFLKELFFLRPNSHIQSIFLPNKLNSNPCHSNNRPLIIILIINAAIAEVSLSLYCKIKKKTLTVSWKEVISVEDVRSSSWNRLDFIGECKE